MTILNSFDTDKNFWMLNPQLKVMGAFKNVYETDKSKNKTDSSTLMWAISFLLDSSEENKFRNLSYEDKKYYLAKDFLKNEDFNWETHKEVIEFYRKTLLTAAQRNLIEWEEIMDMRSKSLKEWYKEALTYKSIETIAELDKLLSTTNKHYQDFAKIKKEFDAEAEAITRGAGNKIKSLTETGEI